MRNALTISSHTNQQGIGLIEVMVALMLLAIAVLGFSAMQMTAVKATDESLMRTRALTVIRGGSEMMRANPSGIAAFKKAISDTKGSTTSVTVGGTSITASSCMGSTATCTINQLAARDAITVTNLAKQNAMQIALLTCPNTANKAAVAATADTDAQAATFAQERQCFVASWGDTKPMFDASDAKACANANGIYKNGAQCFIMEAY